MSFEKGRSMTHRIAIVLSILFILSAAFLYAQAPAFKTGDITEKGLTVSDFPRLIKLANNVYAYEMSLAQPVASGERFTTNSLIVITTDGVLVADGQGNPADTARLVQEIGKLTNQPIKYVVIGSDHG